MMELIKGIKNIFIMRDKIEAEKCFGVCRGNNLFE